MPKSARPDDEKPEIENSIPNRAANQEPAEGSRDNVNGGAGGQTGAGISNRPLEQEQEEQQSLPPRGENKEGGHA